MPTLQHLAATLDTAVARRLAPRYVPLPSGYFLARFAGSTIRYRVAGEGEYTLVFATDPPVVLEQYDELIAELRSSFRVVVFEIPGFGFSTPGEGLDFSFARMNAVIGTFVQSVTAGPTILYFPCVTAYGGLAFARARPDLVRGVVVAQAPSWSEELRWKARRDPRGLLGAPVLGQLAIRALKRHRAPRWFDLALGDRERLSHLCATTDLAFKRGAHFCLASVFQQYLSASAPGPALVSQPILALWGDRDGSHRETRTDSSRELGEHVELMRFDDLGHFPELESPARLADILRNFRAGLR